MRRAAGALLPRLPGRRFVFTNGDAPYARRVLEAIGVAAISTTCTTSTPASYRPKPDPHGYALAVRAVRDRSRSTRCSPTTWSQNLAPAKALGMTTVWVDNGSERGNHGYDEALDRLSASTDIGDWLESILGDEDDE